MITTKRPTKFFAMITYVVALICLVVGFVYPYSNTQGANGMIAMQLPDVINTLFGTTLDFGYKVTFPGQSIALFGIEGMTINNVYAWLILAYAAVTILGVLALIPICISNRYKSVAKVLANIVEIAAIIVLGFYVLNELATFTIVAVVGVDPLTLYYNWAPYLALGGVSIVFIIQGIQAKGGSGIIKALLFILSALGVYALTNLFGLYGQFSKLFGNIENTLNATGSLYTSPFTKTMPGILLGYALFTGEFFSANGIIDTLYAANAGIGEITAIYCGLIICLLASLNVFLDMLGIAKKTNKGMLICNLVRYFLLVAAAVTLTILVIVLKGQVGLMLYLILIVGVVALLINVIRFIKYVKAGATDKAPTSYSDPAMDLYGDSLYDQLEGDTLQPAAPAPVYQPVQEYQSPIAVETAPQYVAPIPAPIAAQPRPVQAQPRPTQVQTMEYQQVYNISSVYNGPTDNFIKKLTNDEKIEFAKVFLERRYGPLTVIPTYNFGGDNKKFFSAIFIYISRVREYLSDSLMNKIYEELNLLRQ